MLLKSTKARTNVYKNYFMHNAFSVWLLLYRGIWTHRVLKENTWSAETWESLLSSVSFKSAAIPCWPGSRQLPGEAEAWPPPLAGKPSQPGPCGLLGGTALPSQGQMRAWASGGLPKVSSLCRGWTLWGWITSGFDSVVARVMSWLNSSLINVEWEELMALCFSHLVSAFFGRNSQWREHIFFPHVEASV